jgi:hypothetical protein
MQKPTLKLKCCDFSPGQEYTNYVYALLAKHYAVEISEDPDLVLYSCHGRDFLRFSGTRLYYTGENTRPNFAECDYAISFDLSDDPRHFRYPDYASYGDASLLLPARPGAVTTDTRRFCNFIYSNWDAPERIRFCVDLARYRHVDALGDVLRNSPPPPRFASRHARAWIDSKVELLRQYKFTIAFENESHPGYVTEKIFHAFLAGSIPIYWGNPRIELDFNPRAFINVHAYPSYAAAIRAIREVDANPELYAAMRAEPCFPGNQLPESLREDRLRGFLAQVINASKAGGTRREPRPAAGTPAEIAASQWRRRAPGSAGHRALRRLRNRLLHALFLLRSQRGPASGDA